MVKEVFDDNCSEEFLNIGQYQRNGILRYERVFGHTYVSTGGKQTTQVCGLLDFTEFFFFLT